MNVMLGWVLEYSLTAMPSPPDSGPTMMSTLSCSTSLRVALTATSGLASDEALIDLDLAAGDHAVRARAPRARRRACRPAPPAANGPSSVASRPILTGLPCCAYAMPRERGDDRDRRLACVRTSSCCLHLIPPLGVDNLERSGPAHQPSRPSGENSTIARNTTPITRLKRSRSMTSMAKVCSSTKTIAPRNAPIGWRMPPSTAMTRMLMSQLVPTEPGVTSPLYQVNSTPPTAGDRRRRPRRPRRGAR